MGMTIDNNFEPKPMNKEEIVDTLKSMVFGAQAFKRFNAKEREALDLAISQLESDNSVLEDIKAEIEKRADDYLASGDYDGDLYNSAYKDALYWCFDLIDKHMESEDNNGMNT